MKQTAEQVVAGLKGMCDAGMEVQYPDFLDFEIQVAFKVNGVPRVAINASGDKTTLVTSKPDVTDQDMKEFRQEGGGDKSTTTYEWEDDT